MIRKLQTRDNKEAKLSHLLSSISHSDIRALELKDQYKKQLELYQKWKADNKVEGVLF